ncbi:Protein of unknown function UPF0058 [Methanosalsum zhilinae DSM 4017]|uniref:Metal-binding protein n=1 Tax=Methanosalsum zhilinae (strain DSM 4017 / NBRC 107636 / OCM 62 / WeN5) TaxID=679901 RepID=F7XMI5_METZD|nr:UPF0058 family protein [Methanosalsum zhilinae]AEH59908.1 Protein of unknown function UPF0058 [Methanosalsum zhilinae DSM 4017]
MHKDELIQLHTLMAQIKRYFESQGIEHDFEEYQSLSISPMHIHRSKAEHKHAIFVLGNHLASIISEDENSSIAQTTSRMQELAAKSGNEIAHSN